MIMFKFHVTAMLILGFFIGLLSLTLLDSEEVNTITCMGTIRANMYNKEMRVWLMEKL